MRSSHAVVLSGAGVRLIGSSPENAGKSTAKRTPPPWDLPERPCQEPVLVLVNRARFTHRLNLAISAATACLDFPGVLPERRASQRARLSAAPSLKPWPLR